MKQDKKTCYCCGYMTLTEGPGEYDICPVCFWEDDGSGFINSNSISGANMGLRLSEAQQNFKKYGVFHPKYKDKVRPPLPGEIQDKNWKPISPKNDE